MLQKREKCVHTFAKIRTFVRLHVQNYLKSKLNVAKIENQTVDTISRILSKKKCAQLQYDKGRNQSKVSSRIYM